jgi:hypothetical protein
MAIFGRITVVSVCVCTAAPLHGAAVFVVLADARSCQNAAHTLSFGHVGGSWVGLHCLKQTDMRRHCWTPFMAINGGTVPIDLPSDPRVDGNDTVVHVLVALRLCLLRRLMVPVFKAFAPSICMVQQVFTRHTLRLWCVFVRVSIA